MMNEQKINLQTVYFSDLKKAAQKRAVQQADSVNPEAAELLLQIQQYWSEYSASILDAQLAIDPREKLLYDVRIFDPHHHLPQSLYTDFSGWTEWLLGWTDPDTLLPTDRYLEHCGEDAE